MTVTINSNGLLVAAGTLGHYQVSVATGAIAAGAAADSQVFSCRWSSATKVAVITSVVVTGMRATTAFAAGVVDLKATVARSFTVSASGGTALTITGNQMKLDTRFQTTAFTDMRVATTGALTAGTQTLDTQDLGRLTMHSSAGTGVAAPIVGEIYVPNNGILFDADPARGEHPLVLRENEGLVIRATVPATGVWNLGVQLRWYERIV